MLKKTLLVLAISISLLSSCSQNTDFTPDTGIQALDSRQHTTTGNIKYHSIKSKFLSTDPRDIIVYLPPSYNSKPGKTYPVLYMQDGQNIFDKATGAFGKEWYIDEKVEYLIQKKVIEEIIIVGVYNGLDKRLDEYTWNPRPGEGGGNGKAYGEFLTKEVKTFIDKTYRTKSDRDNTAVAGSSLGGLISFYLAENYSPVFAKIGIMSPSFWWNNGEALKEVSALKGKYDFWLDCGAKEGSDPSVMVTYLNRMYGLLANKFGSEHVLKYIQENAQHNEEAWAVRIHAPIIQFFGTEQNPAKKEALIKRLMVLEEWGKL
jgi:predicted alpha/beta superfamily hydrolase